VFGTVLYYIASQWSRISSSLVLLFDRKSSRLSNLDPNLQLGERFCGLETADHHPKFHWWHFKPHKGKGSEKQLLLSLAA
jgi:hypothetical protein